MIVTQLVLVCNPCLDAGEPGAVKKNKTIINCKNCKTPMKEIGEVSEFRTNRQQKV